MGTTVRVRDEDKEKLERLRAMVTLSSGKKVTQEQLLGTLLDDALSRGESFVTETFGPKLPLSDKDFAKIMGLISDWGVVTSSADIDRILYGSTSTEHRKK
jgi:hypothetical protein